MRAVDILRKKRDGGELSEAELATFVREATHRTEWEEYQLSALLMAIYFKGMTPAETATFTRLMTDSGKRLDLSDLPGPRIDKHSTGGVGDKTSIILAPLAAACGITVPMMSGRGLGHTGGTLDKLESIPGFRVNLSEAEFRAALKAVGIGMIGQTADVAPADKTLYALRDVTSTVESLPLITASILSKKLAEGITGLVLDVKCGAGAFMKTRESAMALAQSLFTVGKASGLKCEALLTAMDAPLGRAVGNANEIIECIETLKGNGPHDLTELSVILASRMVHLGGTANCEGPVRKALASGAGLEKFRQMVQQQGGDPKIVDDYKLLPHAPHSTTVKATRGGYVATMDSMAVGVAAMKLGAGRAKASDKVDPAVGVMVKVKPGEKVSAGDVIFEVQYRRESDLAGVLEMLAGSYNLSDGEPPEQPLVLETLS
ncbi:pyrimidine-nucleoside phosphorylase [soil metagenome]